MGSQKIVRVGGYLLESVGIPETHPLCCLALESQSPNGLVPASAVMLLKAAYAWIKNFSSVSAESPDVPLIYVDMSLLPP